MQNTIVDIIEQKTYPRSEYVNCPLCNTSRQPRSIQARFGMVACVAECTHCRIAYQTPLPSSEASLAYMNWRWKSSDAYVASKSNQIKRVKKQFDILTELIPTPGKLLDFGAGAGAFVRVALDNGWQASGVELSDSARTRAREYYQVSLEKELPGTGYDVVTLWDVVEHLRQPQQVLKKLYDCLSPGGYIFLETGNYENWVRLFEKDRWGLYLLDHQYYFTPPSLEKMLESAGFGDFKLIDTNHVYPWLPRFIARHPLAIVTGWKDWLAAKKKWGFHGDINVMIGVAQKTNNISSEGDFNQA